MSNNSVYDMLSDNPTVSPYLQTGASHSLSLTLYLITLCMTDM